jgi:hypothetical protein
LDANHDGTADYYAGHYRDRRRGAGGRFGCDGEAGQDHEPSGIATDVSAARKWRRPWKQANAAHAWPDLIVAPFGSAACDLDPTHPGDDGAARSGGRLDAVDQIDRALVVSSSGNRGESRRFYPAAFEPVLAVGALDTATGDTDGNAWSSASRSGPVATFSNFGSWVDYGSRRRPGDELRHRFHSRCPADRATARSPALRSRRRARPG